jgi:hypothetical protein
MKLNCGHERLSFAMLDAHLTSAHNAPTTPAAGTIKTGKPRTVPLHAHLIEQGFLNFERDRGNGPLFCNPKEKEDGTSDP